MTTENGEVVEPVVEQVSAEAVGASIREGYDRIANPEHVEVEKEPTAETPPEPVLTTEQAKDLMAQVSRIPELEKRLRDDGGRYGALKQQLEQIQQRMATVTTASEASATTADASDLLQELRDEYPELADKLHGAFSKVMTARGVNPEDIGKMVADRIEANRNAARNDALAELAEAHPDWADVIAKPEYGEWKATLPARVQARVESSIDPFFVSEMLDQHKAWVKSKTENGNTPEPHAQSSKRLANAVLPTNGTKPIVKGEPNAKEAIRAGYDRVAGARR